MRTKIGCVALLASVIGMAMEAAAGEESHADQSSLPSIREGAPGNRGLKII